MIWPTPRRGCQTCRGRDGRQAHSGPPARRRSWIHISEGGTGSPRVPRRACAAVGGALLAVVARSVVRRYLGRRPSSRVRHPAGEPFPGPIFNALPSWGTVAERFSRCASPSAGWYPVAYPAARITERESPAGVTSTSGPWPTPSNCSRASTCQHRQFTPPAREINAPTMGPRLGLSIP